MYLPKAFEFQTVNAIKVDYYTLLANNNCFAVVCEDGKGISIVNFYYEKLERLLKENIINWPVKISILDGDFGVINDSRIPEDEYNIRFCEVCCPMDLLPIQQKLRRFREVEKGITTYSQMKNGRVVQKTILE